MTLRVADRLSAARRRYFAGRDSELAVFQSAVTASELPFYVLYIYGPGGVGKTTLLTQFAATCAQANIPIYSIDGRDIEPVAEAFIGALQRTIGLLPHESLDQWFADHSSRQVILIDTYETLAPLDAWLREVFLPGLPDHMLVVLAGRQPLSLAWRTDPGWQPLIRTLSLRNLSPNESRSYLSERTVPSDQHHAVLDFTHGHPLALSLVADVFAQRPGLRFQPEAAPDVIKTLLEQFVQKVPGPAHRAALEVCALVRLTTEALLAAILMLPDVHELFDWLRELSFIESGPQGLFPHDLAREALDADVRWRNPDWYADLHRRAGTYYANRLQQTRGLEQQQVLIDLLFLHRNNAIMRPFYHWQQQGRIILDTARRVDWPMLLEIIKRHEGDQSAQLAAYWFERQPQGVFVLRDVEAGGEQSDKIVGLVVALALEQLDTEELEADPIARAVWHSIDRTAPLRQNERAILNRFWMARDTYQSISAVQSLLHVIMVQQCLTTPGLAFSTAVCENPEFWEPLQAYIDFRRLSEADCVIEDHRYGVFGFDWRVMPPPAWLAMLAERELATELPAAPAQREPPPLVVLSQQAFTAAVRDVLHNFARPDILRDNPLLQSRLVVERVGVTATPTERVTALQSLVREACESLQATPRAAKLYRALYHTYLHPTSTQEQTAEALDLPFSTYRRHLTAGVTSVIEQLWKWEIEGGAT